VPPMSKIRLKPSSVFGSSAAGQFGSRAAGFRYIGFATEAMRMAALAAQAPRVKYGRGALGAITERCSAAAPGRCERRAGAGR
jgi:hypothetical protein